MERMLNLISGKSHMFYTCFYIYQNSKLLTKKIIKTRVKVKNMTNLELQITKNIKDYKNSFFYNIEDYFQSCIISIQGSFSNLSGLPIYELKNSFTSLRVS
jgi:predicted house-cleaning NTP pyrophosphatase (Maf/HAM1 superfamily)